MSCRFELHIRGTPRFHCAVRDGASGWMFTYAHKAGEDPCPDCPFKIPGVPYMVTGEVPSWDWGKVAGKQIRPIDWTELKRRGLIGEKPTTPLA